MTSNSREAERQISNHPKGGSGRSYSLEEDGANGSDTVDLSWLSIDFIDLLIVFTLDDTWSRLNRTKGPVAKTVVEGFVYGIATMAE